MWETPLCSMNRSATDAAGHVVPSGFAGQAGAANHEFTLEPHLDVLIRCLLLLPSVPRLNFLNFVRSPQRRVDLG
jgi:hypothetical protein